MSEDQIDGQLSVFDLLPPERDDPLGNKTIAQIAADVSMLVGVNFNPKTWEWKDEVHVEYVAQLDWKNKLTLDESHYDTEDERDGQRFIGCGYSFENQSGGGAPCDTIDEAVIYFRKRIENYKQIKKAKKALKEESTT